MRGEWIEIGMPSKILYLAYVSPREGRWIEIAGTINRRDGPEASLPVRESGLKCLYRIRKMKKKVSPVRRVD